MSRQAEDLVLTFHGVRGSTPCSGPELERYGGNTSCVAFESRDRAPIIFDLGTGLRAWGTALVELGCPQFHALVSHLHWDHVQGLPFFAPLHLPGTRLDVYGPGEESESMGEAFGRFMKPPFFPIEPHDLTGEVVFHDVSDTEFEIEDAVVTVRPVPHTGTTNGYRVERSDVSIAYVSDHQQPIDDPGSVADSVLDLCRNVDVLIHDAQFTPDEFERRSDWGHCTIDYAIDVACQAEARTLVMFHHDPGHDDDTLDRLVADARVKGRASGLESVFGAAEGMKIAL